MNTPKSEPMGAIKRQEPEQNQESPSVVIKNVLVFGGLFVFMIDVFRNAYAYFTISNKLNTTFYQEFSLAIVCCLILVLSFGFIIFLVLLISGDFDDWLKQNIDPYLLRLKSWFNRRNEE